MILKFPTIAADKLTRNLIYLYKQADIQLEDNVNMPQPVYEWTLTDVCGGYSSSTANTGRKGHKEMSITSSVTSHRSWGGFFGNAVAQSDLQLSANQLELDVTEPFTVFYWFKLITSASTLTIVDLQYHVTGQQGGWKDVSVIYASNRLNFYTNIASKFCNAIAKLLRYF